MHSNCMLRSDFCPKNFRCDPEARKNHTLFRSTLQKALTPCARPCLKLELIEGNVLFADGVKMRANAGKGNLHREKRYRDRLEEIDKRTQQILEECEQVDQNESQCG